MQLRCNVLLSCAGLMLLSQVPTAAAVALFPIEEPVTTLVSPPNAQTFVSPMSYTYDVMNGAVATTITATPLLCANTSAPVNPGTALNPVYYSANGLAGTTPLPFVFGAAAATPSVSAMASGAQGVGMSPTEMRFVGDALGSLVCYGLNADGTRRITRDVFEDDLDGFDLNSSVVLSVLETPNMNGYYKYTVDVTIPALPANANCSANGLDCNFVIDEGYDTSVFSTTVGGWCQASPGATQCPGPTTAGDIYMSVAAPLAPNGPTTLHFIAFRALRSGATLPNTGAPVALAAVFSPNDLGENKLDDNVSAGNNQIANAAPAVAQDVTFTSFSASLVSLTESLDSGTLTFDIRDGDTAEPVDGPYLRAAVTLNFDDIAVPVTTNCVSIANQGTDKATRQCTFDIPLNDANWWNSSVASTYNGLFNTLATDTTNGSYASGVTANASIVVTDSLNKSSQALSVPIHVHSAANNPPVVAFGAAMPGASDPNQGGASYPTYSCSIAANNCGATFHLVQLVALATALPGPAAALDELATQTTTVGAVTCGLSGENSAIFANAPVFEPSSGSATNYDALFQFTSPLTAGSSLCSVSFSDQASPFPNGQTAKSTPVQFRIVVNS